VGIPARVGVGGESAILLLDTACEPCVIAAHTPRRAGWTDQTGLGTRVISTRLGVFSGVADRMPVVFEGVRGEALEVDATWLIVEDWPGPMVLGWRACLERLRFALDPLDNWFHFGPPWARLRGRSAASSRGRRCPSPVRP